MTWCVFLKKRILRCYEVFVLLLVESHEGLVHLSVEPGLKLANSEHIPVKPSPFGLLCVSIDYLIVVLIEAITVKVNTVYIPSVSKQRNLPESSRLSTK